MILAKVSTDFADLYQEIVKKLNEASMPVDELLKFTTLQDYIPCHNITLHLFIIFKTMMGTDKGVGLAIKNPLFLEGHFAGSLFRLPVKM